ncbi:class I SAM-dependent methyltransferase [Bradyrhizobium sp. 164]|uniref:class I SAM-dependent methyltransferase n=1 Tax=Bradyrhizobium sp. 164 TaxID=2782637 RepID=UPI001FF748DA|nr:class I SAM-dependent methyltransferase [Bradyrhizobium sp. 164]MCK1597300.1 class I SAM-dependent methyltransferase [Bradyrhizobium sp. 164]
MGIDLTGLRALSFANRVYGFDFRNTVTLGRHEIHFWKQEFHAVQKSSNLAYDQSIAVGLYCEPLLRKLGAQNIVSIDASAFEGASVIHDFNLPIPSDMHEKFDTFLDFGSIEHIFDVAQAVDNIVNLVRPGGHVLIATNANGFPAHGLYQYSPEFFYSLFSKRNGFEDTAVFLIKPSRPMKWHLIKPPVALNRRNQIPFEEQTVMMVFSRKVRSVSDLRVQQSDYDATWTSFATGSWAAWDRRSIPRWKSMLHEFISPFLFRSLSYHFKSSQARRKYRADHVVIDPDSVDLADFARMIADAALPKPPSRSEMNQAERATQLH